MNRRSLPLLHDATKGPNGMTPLDEDRLRSALRRAYPAPAVPSEVDDAIRAEARRALTRQPASVGMPRRAPRLGRWRAAASALFVTGALAATAHFAGGPGSPPVRPTRPPAIALAGDLDGNGALDLRDVHRLARDLDTPRRSALSPRELARADLDRDGVIDRRDLDRLTALAVSLEGAR